MCIIELSKQQARKFLLFHHGLYGDYEFSGKEGIISYINRVGCIQFDPLNVVGKNPELVLQSRIKSFDKSMLYELLYCERRLLDYWDKNMSIFSVSDWPYFQRHREGHQHWCDKNQDAVSLVRKEISDKGALCSGDLEYDEKVNWAWGPTRLSRAALEGMYHAGQLIIHHKADTRKFYDLPERYFSTELITSSDPNISDEDYICWHVLRRIGSVGLLWNRPSDAWLGIIGLKSSQREKAFERLIHENKIIEVRVEGIKHPLYMRNADNDALKKSLSVTKSNERSSILAPLDNLLWDRDLISELFDFEYRWEVYKPKTERKFGYYVLPIVYDDKIVARFEPEKHRKNLPFVVKNWWWESNIVVTNQMKNSIIECLTRFAEYLGAYLQKESLNFD
ncbi:MAG: crosslink repair DNA glycosylase YcaQ family protein [Bacillota bacterium]|nr:crosslink repair DNA glycosylase YcaQ family protein [Bacillota bacterium]